MQRPALTLHFPGSKGTAHGLVPGASKKAMPRQHSHGKWLRAKAMKPDGWLSAEADSDKANILAAYSPTMLIDRFAAEPEPMAGAEATPMAPEAVDPPDAPADDFSTVLATVLLDGFAGFRRRSRDPVRSQATGRKHRDVSAMSLLDTILAERALALCPPAPRFLFSSSLSQALMSGKKLPYQ